MIQLHDYLLVKKKTNIFFCYENHLKKKIRKSSQKKQDKEGEEDSITSNIINKLTNIRLLIRII